MKIVVLSFKIVFDFPPKIAKNRCIVVQNPSKTMKIVVLLFRIVRNRRKFMKHVVVPAEPPALRPPVR